VAQEEFLPNIGNHSRMAQHHIPEDLNSQLDCENLIYFYFISYGAVINLDCLEFISSTILNYEQGRMWRYSCDLTAGTILEFAVVTEEAVNNLIQNIPHPS